MGTAINLNEIKRYEITEVYAHPDAKVDIVFVHGLNGDPRLSWTAKNGVFWPTQLLPASLKTVKARILVYGYNADVYAFGGGPINSSLLHQHAQNLVLNFALERKSEGAIENPIIWIAHSLGGILVKRALELSNDLQSKNAEDNRSIFVSTYGIIFLGTPHTGADPAKWGRILQGMVEALVPKKLLDTDSHLIRTLQKDNETLQNVNLHFLDIYQRFKICMVYESVKTDLKGTQAFVVDQLSASPLLPDVTYFGIEADHAGVAKFTSKNAPGYLNIATTINSWAVESSSIIQARWEMEKKRRQQIREAMASELLESYRPKDDQKLVEKDTVASTPDLSSSGVMSTSLIHSVASIAPTDSITSPAIFIKPLGFRPNSIFVGRKAELEEIHKILFDKKRRRDGTSAVLIQSMPGGGKTHLAREYVYEHRSDFPGGIFWLSAKSVAEVAAGYWDIAAKAALHTTGEETNITRDPQQFITIVREWLNQRQDWLMVLDGIHFGRPEDWLKFLPDTPNSSLIYTSTEKTAGGDHHFMNPQVIKLPLLSAREAQELLLLELDKKKPTTEELSYAMEIVRAMEFLPVVIHVGAQQLKASDELLSKFAKSYTSQPKLRGLGTYQAVVEQLKILGWVEALNLIQILCFFSQHIPVEMIYLGLHSIDIPVRATEPITGRSLNNTFKMLNMFALIDRNDNMPSHSFRSSQSSRDMLADNLDVVRIHSVVQGFFVDTLYATNHLGQWLGHAVKMFCGSYDLAHERITRRSHKGLVEDYRLYQIHGARLREHVVRHQKKWFILEDAQTELDIRLERIQGEIDRRTPESSNDIVEGKSDIFATSIFDRTSSSSDTGPETPSTFGNSPPRNLSWGLDAEQVTVESPASLLGHEFPSRLENALTQNFPRHDHEDDGYDTDNEAVPMTAQNSQRTVKQGSTNSLEQPWQVVRNRRLRSRTSKSDLHRSVRAHERLRYSDSDGAYRAAGVIDPRVSRETAKGTVHNLSSKQSRGRISGKSSAEVALNHITMNSPPPPRGGGKIQDRRSAPAKVLDGAVDSDRMRSGSASYASPVLGSTTDTAWSIDEPIRPASEPAAPSEISSTLGHRPQDSAMASLQRIPHALGRQPAADVPESDGAGDSRTPPKMYVQPYPSSSTAVYEIPGQFNSDDLSVGPKPYPTTMYPRMEGPIPVERRHRSHSSSARPTYLPSPLNYSTPAYSDIPPSMQEELEQPAYGSLSTPDIRYASPFSPGSLFNNSLLRGGYSSQPMSRHQSAQSGQSRHSAGSGLPGADYRRPSLTDSEPPPELPPFSPRHSPNSYQIHERLREQELKAQAAGVGRRPARPSPKLGFARAAMIESLDEWVIPQQNDIPTIPQTRRSFNPAAPPFSPRANIGNQGPQSYYPPPLVPNSTPDPLYSHEMSRSGSGGVRAGGRFIEFGDYPEPVAIDLARERAERMRADAKAFEKGEFRDNGPGAGAGYRHRYKR